MNNDFYGWKEQGDDMEEGKLASERGESVTTNPHYGEDEQRSNQWLQGWIDGEANKDEESDF